MLKALLFALCLLSGFARAAPVVLVDAIPTGAMLISCVAVQVPIPDLAAVNAGEVEAGLASAVSQAISFAGKNGATHISLLSAPGENALDFRVDGAEKKLKLRTRDASFMVVFYDGGDEPAQRPVYSLETPGNDANRVSVQIGKVAVPPDWSTASWVYFNLSRIQAAAVKAGAPRIFLAASGAGASSAVPIPGLLEPLMVFAEQAKMSATWSPRKNDVLVQSVGR